MYEAFRNAINEIFENPDFYQFVYINGIKYKCLASKVEDGIAFTEGGLVNDVNFALDVQITEQNKNNLPRSNDRITFRGKQYKVERVDVDSALCTFKMYIIDNSKGIK